MLSMHHGIIYLILITIVFVFYKYSTRNFDYWKKLEVPFLKPWPVFGNFFEVFTFRKSIGSLLRDFYVQYDFPYLGIFLLDKPHILVKDLDIIKYILIKDFSHFSDRAITSDERSDPIASKTLFLSKNPEWKLMRTKITPIFSTKKVKAMVLLMQESAKQMNSYLDTKFHQTSVEARELCMKYMTNVITSCAYGLNENSFEDNNAPFRIVGRRIFDQNWINSARQFCYFLTPSIVKQFKINLFDPTAMKFLKEVFWKTIKERDTTMPKKNDLIDIIKAIYNTKDLNNGIRFEGDAVIAQAAQFFIAGFETVGSTVAFALYELSLAPTIQNQLRAEVKKTLSEYKELSYEAVQGMKYLGMVISETLRKYPPLPFLDRRCKRDYNIPNTNVTIKKDSIVFISIFGLHYDKKYFPNPHEFYPERFSDANQDTFQRFSYLPFGDGPRNCIGERFGLIAAKIGLASIISAYSIEKTANLSIPIQFSSNGTFLAPTSGIHLKFSKIKTE